MSKTAIRVLLCFAVAAAAQTATYTSATITNGSSTPAAQLQLGSTTATGSKIWSNATALDLENAFGYGLRANNDTVFLLSPAAGPTKIAGEGPIYLRRVDGAIRRWSNLRQDTLSQYRTTGATSVTSKLIPSQLELGSNVTNAVVTGGVEASDANIKLYTRGSCCGQYAGPNSILIGNYQGATFNPWMTVAGGTATGSARVAIAGDATVNGKLFIGTTGWSISAPDYVFGKDYKLASLDEVESYVSENHHLPGIESASAMEAKGGVDLVQMNLDLLKKVEELTLYMIEQNKKIESLQARVGSRN